MMAILGINGTSDIYGHGKLKWSTVPTDISIDKYNVLHLFVDNNQTEDHFNGGIHGITNSFIMGLISIENQMDFTKTLILFCNYFLLFST